MYGVTASKVVIPRRVIYYTSVRGDHIVRDEIARLTKPDIAKVLRAAGRLEAYGESLGGDAVKHVKGKVWELREDRYRLLYFTYVRDTYVILRVFMKKTPKTPERDIRLAERRMNDYLARFPKD